MITNFETITYELTDQELKLVPIFIEGIRKFTDGKKIKAPEIVNLINSKYGEKTITQPRLRKIVNYVRSNGLLPVIATSKGYYVSYDKQEIKQQIRSLKERASAIYSSASGLESFLTETQMQLF